MNILENLNPEQKKAVTHKEGPLLIVAGAGTGKTTVITRRLAWLVLEEKCQSDEILALTFTDKAAGEMVERVDKLMPYGYLDIWVSTFHSFCERILKDNALDIGLPGDFKILNQAAAWQMVRQNLDKFNLDYYKPLGNPTKFIHSLIKHFSRCKDEMVMPEDYLEYAQDLKLNTDSVDTPVIARSPDAKHRGRQSNLVSKSSSEIASPAARNDIDRLTEVANAYHIYQKLLLENNALDFGDLIVYTLKLFKERPAILERYRRQFKYILVDEFQDTNWAQYELVKLLAAPDDNLTVVGDDNQSIYKFRGASVSNILQFKGDFPKAKEIVITENYRARQNMLDLAYKFIKQNDPNTLEAKLGISKELKAFQKGKGIVEHLHGRTLADETFLAADKILELKEKNKEVSFGDFAILVRANHQAEAFIQSLGARGIPYQFLASSGLYSKPVILDIISYLKLLDNYHESPALFRILNLPHLAIPIEDLMELNFLSRRKNWSLYETIKQAPAISKLSSETRRKLQKLLGLIEKHASLARDKSAGKVFFAFIEDFGYEKWLVQRTNSKKSQEVQQATESLNYLNQFFQKIQEFEQSYDDKSVKNFLGEIDSMIESGESGSLNAAEELETVKILTVHGAKGLEFKYVFVVNLVDLRFPSIGRKEPIELPDELVKEIIPEGDIHLQEERRLFYVAMTRAREGLFFTSADDYGGQKKKKLSRFLIELNFVRPEMKRPTGRVDFSQFQSHETGTRKVGEKYILPKWLSFTQLQAFSSCPLQYKYAHILRIPVKGKHQFVFGKTMHNVLHRFFQLFMEGGGKNQTGLFDSANSKLQRANSIQSRFPELEELLKIYEELWVNDWFPTKAEHDRYKKQGLESLKNFYKKIAANPPRPKFLEKDFIIKVGDYSVKGRIDRIDDLGEGEIEIIDYKTGRAKEEKDLSAENKRQLLIYQLAGDDKNIFKEKVSKLTFFYLESNTPVSFLGSDADKEKTKTWIKDTADKIQKSNFSPTPGRQCGFCDFREICEFRS